MNFDVAFARLQDIEGGFSNNPNDAGGATMYGITEAVARAAGYQGAMAEMPLDFAKAVYQAQYWSPAQCAALPGALAWQMFDASVNHGVGRAAMFLQFAAGVAVDGAIGAQTLAAVQAGSVARMVLLFNAQRLRFYAATPRADEVFERGWENRVAKCLEYAAGDLDV